MTTLLAAVVDASRRAADTGSRLAKRDAIAACLRAAGPQEVDIAVAFLSGETRQRKIVGIGGFQRTRQFHRGGEIAKRF